MQIIPDHFELFLQLRPTSAVLFAMGGRGGRKSSTGNSDKFCRSQDNNPFWEERDIIEWKNRFTPSAQKRLKTALDVFLFCATPQKVYNPSINKQMMFTFNFVTLTFSSKKLPTYDQAMKCLVDYIKFITRTLGCKIYVWKLELQKRGAIHFHLFTDVFQAWDTLRKKWNYIQRKNGIQFDVLNPNSTDVHVPYNANDVSRYIAKYMAKNEIPEDFELKDPIKKWWGCSQNIQGKKRPVIQVDLREDEFKDINEVINSPDVDKMECSEFSDFMRLHKTTAKDNLYKRLRKSPFVKKAVQDLRDSVLLQ
jgi:hypothetical protein